MVQSFLIFPMNLKTKFFFFLFPLLFVAGVSAAPTFVTVSDSLAGEDVAVRASGFFAHESATLSILRPDQTRLSLPVSADEFGSLRTVLHGLHFQKAGPYELSFSRATGTEQAHFTVFPSAISAFRSTVSVEREAVEADGKTSAFLSATLRDAFGNPISGSPVQIFSSRNQDTLHAEKTSNAEGIVRAQIFSDTPGVSTISILAGDVLLFSKPEIVFFLSDSDLKNVGADGDLSWGDYLKAQLFDGGDAAAVAYFSFENVTPDVTVGKTFTAKVIARDQNGDTVTSFRGTVRFSSSDDRAQLPADYQFTNEDQGEHSFFLAFTFQTPGEQTLAVHDLNDFRISGEAKFTVSLKGGTVDVPQPSESLVLLTPRPGTYRSARATITGESTACPTIKLTDGPTVLAEDLSVDARGKFLLQTSKLGTGVHLFQAVCGNDPELVSNQLMIRIDQNAPQQIVVTVDPEGDLDPGQPFRVRVTANEPLSGASSIFQSVLTPHEPEGEALVTTLTAPLACGEYPLDVKAIDLLGNEADFPNSALIRVVGCDVVGEGGAGDGKGGAGGEDTIPPTPVENLSAQSEEGKVTLLWSPAEDDGAIANYRVEFGCRELGGADEIAFDQQNTTPDNRTQWYVDGLADTEECEFRVVAIDAGGNESPASQTLSGLTSGAAERMHASVPKDLEKSGGSATWPLIFAILAGGGMLILARRKSRQ